jgi:hypothetical protein
VRDATVQPVAGVTVRFSVTGAVTTGGSCATDAAGTCGFTYQGPQQPGNDLISAYADSDDDNVQDAGEPFAEATKVWAPRPPATLTLEPAAAENPVGTSHTVTATVRDAAAQPVWGEPFAVAVKVWTSSPECRDDDDCPDD